MSVTMVSSISDFFEGSTKVIKLNITKDGVAQDITSDTVQLLLKSKKSDTDAQAVINATADVATSGSSGTAIFNLTPTVTNVTPATYFYQFIWTESSGEKNPSPIDKVKVLEAVYDTP